MGTHVNVDEVLALLDGVKKDGGGHIALCPAHGDKNASLSIGEGEDGRTLLHCHAGCAVEMIVDAMGLSVSDLYETSEDQPVSIQFSKILQATNKLTPIPAEVVERLHQNLSHEQRAYLIAERQLSEDIIDRYHLGFEERGGERRLTIPIAEAEGIYRDIRRWLPPETRKDDSKKILHWKPGYGAARLFPIDQLQATDLVLCEGELDALAMISHSIAAITATCGASTWPDELSEAFTGKTVTILPDNDDPGQKGALKRAESLLSHGVKVRIAQWPK